METKTLTFRKAAASDLDAVTAIYDRLHAQEDAGRVTIGWVTGIYPIRFDAEQALAQAHIAVHGGEIVVNGLDEVVVNLNRRLGIGESRMQRGGIAARVRKELQLLHLRAEDRRGGVAELAVYRVQRVKRGLAEHAVVGLHERDERAVRDGVFIAVLVHRVREFEVGVVEHGVNVIRAGGHFACSGEDCLLLVGQHMLTASADAVDVQAVQLQLGCFGVQTVHVLIADGEQLRGLESGGGLKLDRKACHLRDHFLIRRHAGILIAAALCIVHDRVERKTDLVVQTEKAQQGLAALRQMAAEGGNARNELLRCGKRFAPCVVGREQVLDRPFILRCDVLACRDLSGFHIDLPFRDG